jgi:hypothetical protein
MLPKSHFEMTQKEGARLGLPPGFKLATPFPFAGMNVEDSRIAIDDQEFYFLENYIRIGKGNLRTLWDNGAALYTAPEGKSIVYFDFFNIGSSNFAAVFLSDGTAISVNSSTGVNIPISSDAGTFYVGAQLPATGQWGSQYLLIANNFSSNCYYIWDGSVFYQAGSLGPKVTIVNGGSGYTSAPTVIAYGGSGSGATFSATVNSGSVVNVALTNAGSGYEPGDQVQLLFTGGGSDNGAQLTSTIAAGVVQSIIVTDPGSGYTSPVVAITGGGGTGATATATESGGNITSVTVTSGGSGYTSTPTVAITDGGPGTGATAIAVLSPGAVDTVNIVNGGTGYETAPNITFVGGGGSGATAIATVAGGVITAVTVTDGGSGYTSNPAVVVQTGINRSASATVTLMPFGVSGSSIETFEQRVWLGFPNQVGNQQNGGTFLVSAPGSFVDFATSSGGLVYTSSDPFLIAQYTNLRQSNGYLYPIGDSSVGVVSNVQTSGSPSTTTFNYQNTDPQIGTSWRDSCADFSRTILFANVLGVYGLYGGAVQKISSKLDGLFNNAVFPPTANALTPSSAIANIYNQKAYFLLMTIQDPFTLLKRNAMIGWDEKEWFIASQSTALKFINTQEISSNLTAWGTDGSKLVPLFKSPSTSITKRLSTKLWGATSAIIQKMAYVFFVQALDRSANNAGVALQVSIDNEYSSYPLPVDVVFPATYPTIPTFSCTTGDIYGLNLGMTLTSTSPDFVISNLGMGYIEETAVLGSSGTIEA